MNELKRLYYQPGDTRYRQFMKDVLEIFNLGESRERNGRKLVRTVG